MHHIILIHMVGRTCSHSTVSWCSVATEAYSVAQTDDERAAAASFIGECILVKMHRSRDIESEIGTWQKRM